MRYYIINTYLRNQSNEALIHQASNKKGYPDYESAKAAADRINASLIKRGLARQAQVTKK